MNHRKEGTPARNADSVVVEDAPLPTAVEHKPVTEEKTASPNRRGKSDEPAGGDTESPRR